MELLQVVQSVHTQYITNPAPKQDFFFKYLPLLSPLIVILTFFLNNLYNVVTSRKERRRNWYFKAYFEPNIKKVEEFFSLADSEMQTALATYTHGNDWPSNDTIEFISTTLQTMADAKRKFSIEVLTVLKPAYPESFSDLETILNDFEDACSDAFTNPPSAEAYFQFITKINIIKGDLIKTLSGPALI